MGAISHSEPRVNVSLSVPRFDGAPFLATQLESDLCNVTLLPRAPIHELLEFAFVQSTRNGLKSVLVLDAHSCVSLERSGRIQPGRSAPVDTGIVVHELETCAEIPGSDEMLERMERLAALWVSQGDRALHRDRLRGGHVATAEEIEEHGGRNPDGIPNGLGRCEECGEWTGWCLAPEPIDAPTLVPVYCRCMNDTRCARCEQPFAERTIHGCWWDEPAGALRYVPGTLALAHRCADR
jgi:hypothetical protein